MSSSTTTNLGQLKVHKVPSLELWKEQYGQPNGIGENDVVAFNPELFNKSYVTAGQKPGTTLGTRATVEGYNNTASGDYSHAEGYTNAATGNSSHAEGDNTSARGSKSHAEGDATVAEGRASHTEGAGTFTTGDYSHAEGRLTQAIGDYSHTEGNQTQAIGDYSHAEGHNTQATGDYSHAEGFGQTMGGMSINISGEANATTYEINVDATAYVGKIIALITAQPYPEAIITSYYTQTNPSAKFITVSNTLSETSISTGFVFIYDGISYGDYSHAEGQNCVAGGLHSHAEGNTTRALGNNSHAEGNDTLASGVHSHAEGYNTKAVGISSHAEGYHTTASGNYSHVEGSSSVASGNNSHAEGAACAALGTNSHAECNGAEARGSNSHAEGLETIATHRSQHVFGERNVLDSSTATSTQRGTYVEIVGNGTSDSNRSNVRTLDWNGNEWIAGTLTVGDNPQLPKQVATKEYVDDHDTLGYITVDSNTGVGTLANPEWNHMYVPDSTDRGIVNNLTITLSQPTNLNIKNEITILFRNKGQSTNITPSITMPGANISIRTLNTRGYTTPGQIGKITITYLSSEHILAEYDMW